jgi:hypothetical protein
MRKILVITAITAAALAVPVTVLAATGGSGGSADLQAARWTTTAVTLSGTAFRPLLSLNVCALGPVAATVSAELSGAPAGFRVSADGGPVAQPGAVRFVPAGAHDSASFTFAAGAGTFEANDHHVYSAEVRSPDGRPVTVERATLTLIYHHGTHC